MAKKQRFYTAPDGTQYPLKEAQYDMPFRAYKSDRRKAVQSDPHSCVLAKGIRRNPEVLDVYVGSGLDAYVVFKATEDEPAYALHFTIRTTVRKVIDAFDKSRKVQSQEIILSKPTKGRTLEARSRMNAKRAAEIKAGAEKKTGGPRQSRVKRLGIPRRPTAVISRSGNVAAADLHIT